MANYHFSMKLIKRSAGRSATAAAAYRAGLDIQDERTGERHDYSRRRGVEDHAVLTPSRAPEWAKDANSLWNAVEEKENRKDAQLARENVLALPHELSFEQNRALLHDFVQDAYVKRGMAAQVDIHSANENGDARNIHAHVLLTLRGLTREGWKEKKARSWNERETLREWRAQWAEHVNQALERAGHKERVTEKSFKDLGLDKVPSQHLGPAASEMERRGDKSRIAEENREAVAQNKKMEALAFQRRVMDDVIKREALKLAQEKAKAAKAEHEKQKDRKRNLAAESAIAQKENRAAYERIRILDRGPEFWAQVDKEYAAEERDIKASYNIGELAGAYVEARRQAAGLDTVNGRFSGDHARALEGLQVLEANLKNAKWRQEEALGRLNAEREELRTAKEEREAMKAERDAVVMNAKLNAQFEAQRGGVEIDQPDTAMEQDNAGGGAEDSHQEEQGREQDGGRDDGYEIEL